jgi:heterodisulfide reductase subunit A-like polyferredoxin
MKLNTNIPSGPIEQAWDKARFDMKLVSPANKRGHSLIVVGSGLAGASATASLGELGYNVKCFCFQDSPRARILSPLKAASMRPRITLTTATAFTVFSTTR